MLNTHHIQYATQCSNDTTQRGNDMSGSNMTNMATIQVPSSPSLLKAEHPSYAMQQPNAATTSVKSGKVDI